MTTATESVIALAARHSGFPLEQVTPHHAIYQDLGLIGDDMKAFIAALAVAHGDHVAGWPWRRFTNLNEPTLWTALLALVKVPLRMLRKRRDHASRYERLELGHIAAVIESGQWHNP